MVRLDSFGENAANDDDPPAKLSPYEWDFREGPDYPDDQPMFCAHYEFEREAERRRAEIAQVDEERANPPWDKSYTEADLDKVMEAGFKVFFNEELNHWFASSIRSHFRAYFPRPWLSIPRDPRKEFVKNYLKTVWNPDMILAEVRPEDQGSLKSAAPTATSKSRPKRRGELFTEHAFRITWRFNDGQLLRVFKKWLLDNRPRKEYQRSGRTSFSDLLKALAAYRLLKEYTAKEAGRFTEKVLKYPLYSDEAAWSRAKTSTLAILRKW